MAKKKFSARQLAAQRLFAKRSRAGTLGKKAKSVKKRAKKIITKTKRKIVMAKGKSRTSTKGKLLGLKVPSIVKKAAAGAGMVAIGVAVLNAVGQGQIAQNPIVKAGLGFLGGDFIGAATAVVLNGGINLGSLSGRENQQANNLEGIGFA